MWPFHFWLTTTSLLLNALLVLLNLLPLAYRDFDLHVDPTVTTMTTIILALVSRILSATVPVTGSLSKLTTVLLHNHVEQKQKLTSFRQELSSLLT